MALFSHKNLVKDSSATQHDHHRDLLSHLIPDYFNLEYSNHCTNQLSTLILIIVPVNFLVTRTAPFSTSFLLGLICFEADF